MGSASQVVPGVVWAFRFHAGEAPEEIADCAALDDHEDWAWLHCNLADVRLGTYLRANAHLPAAATELLFSMEEHQQLHVQDACIYGVFADLVCGLDGLTGEIGFLHFLVTDKLFLTGRRNRLHGAEALRKSLQGGRKADSPAALLEGIVETIAMSVEIMAEALAADLDRVEEGLIVDGAGDHPQTLAQVRRLAVRLHRMLVTQRSLINGFEPRIRHAAHPTLHFETSMLARRFDWLDHEIVALRDRARLLQEEVSLKMAEQTNRNLQVLAIVTTVFLPASLIASVFGMNVSGLPLTEDPSGFLWALLLLVGAAALVCWLLKRWGLLGR